MGDRVLAGLPPEGMECKPLEKLNLGVFQDGQHVPTLTYDCNEHWLSNSTILDPTV